MHLFKTFSIVIPVLGESAIIGRTVSDLLRIRGGREAELIVVDGDPEGATIGVLDGRPVRRLLGPTGRGRQMHHGAVQSRGDILMFLHADTRLESDALVRVAEAVGRNGYFAGAFDLGIDGKGPAFRLIERGASLRSRITRIPYGDQAIFIRRDLYFRVGGFKGIPLMEDVDLMRRVKRSGASICILPARAWTSPRRWRREGILYCTLRNWFLVLLYRFGVSPKRLARFYQ